MRRIPGFPPPPTVGALSTGMTKKHTIKNVIPRLDRGIQVCSILIRKILYNLRTGNER